MPSRRTCIPKMPGAAGFTLIETLIVIGILALVVAFSSLVDLTSYRGEAFRAERDALVTVLQTARANALNNIYQQPHGVAILDDPIRYVIFEGRSYASSTPSGQTVIHATYPIVVAIGSLREIVFSQLSGSANSNGDIHLKDPQRNVTFDISVNYEGRISW